MLHRRVRRYLGHLLSQPHRTVAAVTHAGVIRCFYACLANVPLTGVLEMGVGYGDVFVAETAAARGGASIVRLG
jgi:alpha-ribazole phosphatase